MNRPGPLRPVDAASVVLIDRRAGEFRVLMGKRSSRHVFMPEVYVFPGGRRDRSDSRVPVAAPLHQAAAEWLMRKTPSRTSEATVRGLGVAALRELHEEAGLAVGAAADNAAGGLPFRPDLSGLRFFARAITPPGQTRRFDTRFFALFADEARIDPDATQDSHELSDLQWIDPFGTSDLEMPIITVRVLEELGNRLRQDPSLPFGTQAALFSTRNGQIFRDML